MIRAPSVFRADEVDMHKYSAVLAATEPFRYQANEAVKNAIGPLRYIILKLKGKSIINQALGMRSANKDLDIACEKYEQRVESTLRSYGMSAADFNEISSRINQMPQTKNRVILQAYYYKIAADLQANLKPTMPVLPSISKESSPHSVGSSPMDPRAAENSLQQGSPLTRFCSALQAIEYERLRHRDYIKAELKMTTLPPRMSDPEYLPAMSPVIQKASANFPKVASSIITKYQIPIEEFNRLQERIAKDPLFRIRVHKEIKRLENISLQFKNRDTSIKETSS